MATAKQIAARKLFAKRAKAGEFAKKKTARKANPAKKKVAVKRAAVSGSRYVTRPSQITRKAPTKRLKSRRTENLKNLGSGYFPNPTTKSNLEPVKGYWIGIKRTDGTMMRTAFFIQLSEAKRIAQALSNESGSQWFVEAGSRVNVPKRVLSRGQPY